MMKKMKDILQEVIDGNLNPYDLLDLWKGKPLDREDIESFGFIKEDSERSSDVYLFNGDVKECKIIISATTLNLIEIERYSWNRMQMIIKNKSELKRVLTQIGVI